MKRLITFIALTTFILSTTYAQERPPIRYQGDVQANYSVGIGDFAFDRTNIHIINGVRFNPYLFTGMGTGLDYYSAWTSPAGDFEELAMPFYLNIRGYMPTSKYVSLFVSMDIGVTIGLTEGLSGLSGLMATPAMGITIHLSPRHALNFGLGYNIQQWSQSGIAVNTDAIQLKTGFSF